MSLILDALRRNPEGDRHDSAEPGHSARADAVLAMLGYPRRREGGGPNVRRLVLYGVGAIALGFIAVSGVVLLLTPPETPARSPASRTAARQAPSVIETAPVAGASSSRTPQAAAPVEKAGSPAPQPSASVAAGGSTRTLEPPPAAQARVNRVAQPSTPVAGAGASPAPRVSSPAAASGPSRARPALAPSNGPSRPAPRRRTPSVARPAPAPAVAPPSTPAPQPSTPRIDHFAMALYYQRLGDFDRALVQYRMLIGAGGSAELHNNLGLLYQQHGQSSQAIKEFQQAIALDPRYVRAHNNLGVALLDAGRLDAADRELRVALADDPRNVESVVNLALVQQARGRSDDARQLLQHAVSLDPRNAGAHYNLAVVADQGGDRAVAVAHYREFLRYGTVVHSDLVPQVRARLAALGG